jgi:hypothetical protein
MFNSVTLTREDLRTVVHASPHNFNATTEGGHAMNNTSRSRRTADPRRRRCGASATGVGIAVGGAMAAAFASMGTASADDLVVPATDADAVTQLLQTVDPAAVPAAAAPAAAVPAATLDAFEQLVLTIDPAAFDATGNPTDFLGQFAVQVDTDLATTVFGPELNTIAGQVSCLIAVPPTCTDLLATVPTTGDNGFTVLEQFVANTYVPEIIPAVLAPSLDSDLASIASQLDAYFAPTVFGPEIFTIASQIVAGL